MKRIFNKLEKNYQLNNTTTTLNTNGQNDTTNNSFRVKLNETVLSSRKNNPKVNFSMSKNENYNSLVTETVNTSHITKRILKKKILSNTTNTNTTNFELYNKNNTVMDSISKPKPSIGNIGKKIDITTDISILNTQNNDSNHHRHTSFNTNINTNIITPKIKKDEVKYRKIHSRYLSNVMPLAVVINIIIIYIFTLILI